jgi:hypothetical protein
MQAGTMFFTVSLPITVLLFVCLHHLPVTGTSNLLPKMMEK